MTVSGLRRIAIFILAVFLLSTSLFSLPYAKFERIAVKEGLLQSIVTCIIQDKKGFLWVGTSHGLNRYDGYTFVSYKNDPKNDGSISNNKIHSLYEDKKGVLWVGTSGGLNKYNRETDSFNHYHTKGESSTVLSHNEVFPIFEDHDGALWAGTYGGGLNKLVDGKVVALYKHEPGKPRSLSNDRVWAIHEDAYKRLWIGTDDGLNKFDRKSGTFTHYRHDPADPLSISNNTILAICNCKDSRNVLWIGTMGGLNKMEISGIGGLKFTGYFHDNTPGSLSDNYVKCLLGDRDGNLWVGTFGGGLNRFDRQKETFIRYRHIPSQNYSISHDLIYSLYQDKGGILWIGTRGGGLNKFKIGRGGFSLHRESPRKRGGLEDDNVILSIYEEPSGEIWVGTFGGGLNRYDEIREHVTSYRNDRANPHSLADNNVRAIHRDGSGNLWIGTDKGLDKYDAVRYEFDHFPYKAPDPRTPGEPTLWKIMSRICEDVTGKLWMGTDHGLLEFDRGKETFKPYVNEPGNRESLPGNFVLDVCREKTTGLVWIGTYEGGLSCYDPGKRHFTHYRHNPRNGHSLSNNTVRCIHFSSPTVMWVGTDGGLNQFNTDTQQFIRYTEEDGLANNTVYGILEDNAGNLWISTFNGLSKLNTESGDFINYDVRDGLQSNEFNHGAYFKNPADGEMFFGGSNGFNSFFPAEVTGNNHKPAVVITDFRLLNKPVPIGKKGESPLQSAITETDKIILSYRENIFSFEFAALDFWIPQKNKYRYMMTGVDKNWNDADADSRFVIYGNVAPGTYTFRVKASNNAGLWNEKGTSIKIIITPPFWHTWWFRFLVGFLAVMAIIGWYKRRTRWMRAKLVEQERVRKILEQSRDEMEKSRDLAEFRSAENEKLIAAISSIFIAVDADGKVSQWNNASETFFMMPEDKVRERLLKDLLKDYIAAAKLDEIIEDGLHKDVPSTYIEIPVQFPGNGQSRLLAANINPILDKSGKKYGFLLLAEDITNLKKEEMQRHLSQKLEALGQMAAGIAHEIRSPLQYIGDNGRFLQEAFDSLVGLSLEIKHQIRKLAANGNQPELEAFDRMLRESDFNFYVEEIPKAAEQIVSGVARVSSIVKSMNEFSYAGNGVEEKSDLNELLKSTLVVAHNRLKKVADVETDFTPDLPHIYCGMGELNQVFLNLLINAADAISETGRHGHIFISSRLEDDELIVEITDNGIGIPDDIKEKIFTPFFTTKKVGQGTGQGLPFSHRIIVDRHKGKLYFKSKVNEGTTFYIHLPIDEDTDKAPPEITG